MGGMAGTSDTLVRHPVEATVTGIGDRLKDVRDVPLWSMDPATTRQVLRDIAPVKAQLAELEARVLAHGQAVEIEAESGATSTANWWAHQTQQTRAGAHRMARLATALAKDLHEPVRLAMADGALLPDQAEAVIAAIEALPDDLDTEIRDRAQGELIEQAGEFDAKALRILGGRILEVVAPEVGEAHEARLLNKQERDAEAAASLRMSDDGHGRTHGRFTVPTYIAHMLRKAVLAYAAPKHRAAADGQAPAPGRPTALKLGQAFGELIEGLDPDRLPSTGGTNATVVGTIPLETLMGGLKAAQLDTGLRISPGLARRLACRAGIIPAVLGGKSEVLDLGRKRRFHSKAQRIALAIQLGGCIAEGCDWPPGMCHAHHGTPWSRGGDTSVENGSLLCPRHHARAHDPGYETTRLPEGKVRFHRRT